MKKLNLNESFISRIWQNPDYYENLFTTENKKVEIISYGAPNYDSGADFKEALVKIDNVLLSGDIEIHKSFKDWNAHNHNNDAQYNKVILEIIFWDDKISPENFTIYKRKIPTVILSKFLKYSIHTIWKDIINNPSENFRIPCHDDIVNISDEDKQVWISESGINRLIYRSERIKSELENLSNSQESYKDRILWEKLFLIFTFEALGFSKNKSPFLELGRNINLKQIKTFSGDLRNCDALLFGMSGFLEDHEGDEYKNALYTQWNEIRHTIKPETLHKSDWIFFKLRPKNFPTIRLASASGILFETMNNDFLKRIIRCTKYGGNIIKDLILLFNDCKNTGYWNNHYDFGKETGYTEKILGNSRIYDIIVNVVLPLLYLYSKIFKDDDLFTRIKNVFKTEKDKSANNILKVMSEQLQYKPRNIAESQGLIHLHNFYCVKGNCGECRIGEKVFDKFAVKEVLQIILY